MLAAGARGAPAASAGGSQVGEPFEGGTRRGSRRPRARTALVRAQAAVSGQRVDARVRRAAAVGRRRARPAARLGRGDAAPCCSSASGPARRCSTSRTRRRPSRWPAACCRVSGSTPPERTLVRHDAGVRGELGASTSSACTRGRSLDAGAAARRRRGVRAARRLRRRVRRSCTRISTAATCCARSASRGWRSTEAGGRRARLRRALAAVRPAALRAAPRTARARAARAAERRARAGRGARAPVVARARRRERALVLRERRGGRRRPARSPGRAL